MFNKNKRSDQYGMQQKQRTGNVGASRYSEVVQDRMMNTLPVYERLNQKARLKNQNIETNHIMKEMDEMKDCTFRPKINIKSRRLLNEMGNRVQAQLNNEHDFNLVTDIDNQFNERELLSTSGYANSIFEPAIKKLMQTDEQLKSSINEAEQDEAFSKDGGTSKWISRNQSPFDR